jgi:hypothetical protein
MSFIIHDRLLLCISKEEDMSQEVLSVGRRLYYALGAMLIIIVILVLAILLFVSFGSGPSWQRGITGIILTLLTFTLVWLSLDEGRAVRASWIGIIAGMTAWMVVGEISHQFGFVEIESETGLVLLLFATVTTVMLWVKTGLPWGFRVFTASFLLNWWGHALLLPQLYLAEKFNAAVFDTTFMITGVICLAAFAGLVVHIIRKPADKARLIYYGLWLYALLVTGIEGVTNITSKTFGH